MGLARALELLAQQPVPTIDDMYFVMLVSRVLHILGAAILVGGLFYIRFVLSPANAPPGTTPADQFFGGRRAAWAKWVGIATALLLATGFLNYIRYMKVYDLPKSYHMILGMKMLAAIVLFLLAALIAGRTKVADSIRTNWRLWLAVSLLIAIVTISLGSVLRTYRPEKKVNGAEVPKLVAPAEQPSREP